MTALYRAGRQADALRVYSGPGRCSPTSSASTRRPSSPSCSGDPEPRSGPGVAGQHLDPTGGRRRRAGQGRAGGRRGGSAEPVARAAARSRRRAPSPAASSSAATSSSPSCGECGGRASAGSSHIALLQGEAGAGKSRLAAHFAAEVHAVGAVVLWGRATPEAIVPFEPMVEAVRAVLRAVSNEARRRVAAERGLLALLLPELEQLVPEARLDRPGPERRALPPVRDGRRAAAQRVVDAPDAHRPGRPPVGRRAVAEDDRARACATSCPGRVMVVATVRVTGRRPDPRARPRRRRAVARRAAHTALGRRAGDGERRRAAAAERRRRAPRRRAARRDGWQRLLPDRADPPHRRRGRRRATGVDPGDDRTAPRPPRPARRAGAQPGGGRRQAATLPVLVDASGLHGDELLDATDAAVAAGLLVEDGAGRLGVPHALIGQAIRSRLGRTRRLDLHRRVAGAIEQASEPQSSPAILAHHLLEAGSLIDRDTRIAAGLPPVSTPSTSAPTRTPRRGPTASTALITTQVGARERVELELLRGDVARSHGDRAGAIAAAREAATWAGPTGDPMLLAGAAEGWMMSLSGVGFDIGSPADPDLVELMERAIAELPRRAAPLPRPHPQHARVGPGAGPGPGAADGARRRGHGDRRRERRERARWPRRCWPAAWRCGSSITSTSGRRRCSRRSVRPPRGQRAARADGDALRDERPARARPDGRAPRDARRVHGARRRAAPAAVRRLRPVRAGVARPVGG